MRETEYKNIFLLIFYPVYNNVFVSYCHASNCRWPIIDILKRIFKVIILTSFQIEAFPSTGFVKTITKLL